MTLKSYFIWMTFEFRLPWVTQRDAEQEPKFVVAFEGFPEIKVTGYSSQTHSLIKNLSQDVNVRHYQICIEASSCMLCCCKYKKSWCEEWLFRLKIVT